MKYKAEYIDMEKKELSEKLSELKSLLEEVTEERKIMVIWDVPLLEGVRPKFSNFKAVSVNLPFLSHLTHNHILCYRLLSLLFRSPALLYPL